MVTKIFLYGRFPQGNLWSGYTNVIANYPSAMTVGMASKWRRDQGNLDSGDIQVRLPPGNLEDIVS